MAEQESYNPLDGHRGPRQEVDINAQHRVDQQDPMRSKVASDAHMNDKDTLPAREETNNPEELKNFWTLKRKLVLAGVIFLVVGTVIGTVVGITFALQPKVTHSNIRNYYMPGTN